MAVSSTGLYILICLYGKVPGCYAMGSAISAMGSAISAMAVARGHLFLFLMGVSRAIAMNKLSEWVLQAIKGRAVALLDNLASTLSKN